MASIRRVLFDYIHLGPTVIRLRKLDLDNLSKSNEISKFYFKWRIRRKLKLVN